MTFKPKPKPLPFIRELKDLQRIKNDLIALRDHLRKNYAAAAARKPTETPATLADDKAGDAHEQICEVIGILMGVTANLETPS